MLVGIPSANVTLAGSEEMCVPVRMRKLMLQAYGRNVLIKMFFPSSFYNSCIIWETAVEICLCKSVNHYQLAEVILCGDSSVLSTLLNLAALSSHQHYPIDVLNVTIPLAKRATEAAWWFVKCGGITSARQRELWEALLWEIEIKNLLQELIWTVRTHFCIWKLFLLFYNLKKPKIIHIN